MAWIERGERRSGGKAGGRVKVKREERRSAGEGRREGKCAGGYH